MVSGLPIKVVFSLYGSADKYHAGLVDNTNLVRLYYPGATIQVFYDGRIPKVLDTLEECAVDTYFEAYDVSAGILPLVACRLYSLTSLYFVPGSVVLIRDTDSRITDREQLAVQEWLFGGKTWHSMRDHPAHYLPMQGGMIGYRAAVAMPIERLWSDWTNHQPDGWDYEAYGVDQHFLREAIWPRAQNDCHEHDTFGSFSPNPHPFPPSRTDGTGAFVGEVFAAHGTPRDYERQAYLEARARMGR